jgi:mannose-1-phosphate guanylyltransferase/phosphomannomutase
MKAIIMAGGEGTRLRPILPDAPKPMAPLLGKPVMQRIVELLEHYGVTDICVTLRYMPESVMGYFGNGGKFGVNMTYKVEEKPLGTAGGVRACREFYGDRDFLVISGDAACDFDIRALAECQRRHGNAVTMALYEQAFPLSYGLVLTDSFGVVKSFIEKPDWNRVVTNRVNTGIYMLSPKAMEYVPEGATFDFAKDLFPALLNWGERLMGLPMEGYWCDIGTPEAYYHCNTDALFGRLKIYGERPEIPVKSSPDVARIKSSAGSHALVSCRDRALLMRRMSESLMEAGADFTDGLRLKTPDGEACIRASEGDCAIGVDCADKLLRERLIKLAEGLEGG